MKRIIAFLLLVLALPIMAWAGPAKSDYNWQNSGRQVFFDGSTYETLSGLYPITWSEDFLLTNSTAPYFPKTASTGFAMVRRITGNATAVANQTAPGFASLILKDVRGADDAALSWGGVKSIPPASGPVMETRIRFNRMVNGTAEAQVGLFGTAFTGTAIPFIGFDFDGSGVANIRCWNGTTQRNATTTTTLSAGSWYILRIDLTSLSKVRYFINGAEVGTTSMVFNAQGVGNFQPGAYVNKTTNGVTKLDLDYFKLLMNR